MFHVCLDCAAESLLCALHEVAAATTVDVDFYTARYYIHTFGVNNFCAYNGEVAVCNLENLVVSDDY